jgi:type III restriction enzyme
MSKVKIKFDENQEYQIKAVNAVVDLFDGLSRTDDDLSFESITSADVVANTDEVFEEYWLAENLAQIQQRNGIEVQSELSTQNSGDTLTGEFDFYSYPEFTVNMETGTGKTYVYLRTIYSLREKYGFRKFIVVVPSVAIYEGAVATFNATRTHFHKLFPQGTIPNNIIEYDGNVKACKDFAQSNSVQIMLMTIDSFNKASNVLFKETDKIMGGKLPIEFIQETRPVLILDEVQNYQTDTARRALRTLHPLFSVGYSATPGTNPPNLLYNLTPFDAMQMNLVKKIEIFGSEEDTAASEKEDYFKILQINKKPLSVEMQVNCKIEGSLKSQTLTFKQNDSLKSKTKNNSYLDLTVTDISAIKDNEYVEFSNGFRYGLDESSCASLSRESIFREMIHNTIEAHIEREGLLNAAGYKAKVLSLFFVDRVSSYNGEDPIIKRIFDEEFNKMKLASSHFKDMNAEDVRTAYFAKKRDKKTGEETEIDIGESGKIATDEKEAEKAAYQLIMQDKEKLLDTREPHHFIFAHSALREGWDNPNVFQICSLREIKSEGTRRQAIGRGLRLPVQEGTEKHPEFAGTRITDHELNKLVIVASESFEKYAKSLYEEYRKDGINADNMTKPGNYRRNVPVKRTAKFDSPEFDSLWTKMNQKTTYNIRINTEELIKEAVEKVNRAAFKPAQIVTTKGQYVTTKYRFALKNISKTGSATLLVEISDSNGRKFENNRSEKEIAAGKAVDKTDAVLAKIKVQSVNTEDETVSVNIFKEPLEKDVPREFEFQSGQALTVNSKDAEYPDVPKPNLLARVSSEVPLTRATILNIFKGIKQTHQMEFLRNPEAFIAQFVQILSEVVKDHIAKYIEYTPTSSSGEDDRNELFPDSKTFPASELEVANIDQSIYNKIQVDSNVEKNFVKRLNEIGAPGNVQLYFKFPSQYKVKLPKIIGNYNPDWAILRTDGANQQLEIVRETKGTEDVNALPHSNEARKIICGYKHFAAVGVDYRFVDDKDEKWFEKSPVDLQRRLLEDEYKIPQQPEWSMAAEPRAPYKA